MDCDVAIVGSGPAGATVACHLAEAGLDVVVVEAGPYIEPRDYPGDSMAAMCRMYRDAGAQVTARLPAIPLVQGVAVGGTSIINGAISWRLPRDVWSQWVNADPALEDFLDWRLIEDAHREVERFLGIRPTDPSIAGRNNDLLARGAEALGLAHRPIRRNVTGCSGLGRCLQGCPEYRKASMDQSYLPRASRAGARVLSCVQAMLVCTHRGRATGIRGRSPLGAEVCVQARHGVVVAASAVHTPLLLRRSGMKQGPVGDNFQAHPGVAVSGRFARPVHVWRGATQGHEVTGLRQDGLKFEALGFGRGVALGRLDGVGTALARSVEDAANWAHWGAAVRARARGRVRASLTGRARVDYRLTASDVRIMRRGVAVLGELLFAAGARRIAPKVHGWQAQVDDLGDWRAFEDRGPVRQDAYTPVVTHMFGTTKMGSNPAASVVRPDFRHHHTHGLWVADSSVFPTNTGVNPQTSICALASLCARFIEAA